MSLGVPGKSSLTPVISSKALDSNIPKILGICLIDCSENPWFTRFSVIKNALMDDSPEVFVMNAEGNCMEYKPQKKYMYV